LMVAYSHVSTRSVGRNFVAKVSCAAHPPEHPFEIPFSFLQEVQKAYSCSRSSYCCGSGLVDGPSQWDKCCISENPGDHKLGLWWTLGLCMFVMILVAVGESETRKRCT